MELNGHKKSENKTQRLCFESKELLRSWCRALTKLGLGTAKKVKAGSILNRQRSFVRQHSDFGSDNEEEEESKENANKISEQVVSGVSAGYFTPKTAEDGQTGLRSARTPGNM